MDVKSILASKGREVATVAAEASLGDAVAILGKKRIGALVVVGAGDTISGILSERDVVRCLAEKGAGAISQRVGDVMTRKVITCAEDDSVQSLMETMTAGKFRHIPVADKGRLVGIVSIGDVVKERLAQMESESSALRSYIMSA